MFNETQRAELRERLGHDRMHRLAGNEPAMLPVFSTHPGQLCALPPGMDERSLAAAARAAPSWRNEVIVRSVENMNAFEPAGWVPYVSPTPLLIIVGTGDVFTFPRLQLDVYAVAREPKQLVLHPGGHFETYTTYFAQTSRPAADWFTDHLVKPRFHDTTPCVMVKGYNTVHQDR